MLYQFIIPLRSSNTSTNERFSFPRFVMNMIASNLLSIFLVTGLLIANSLDASSLAYSRTPTFCALSEGFTALVTTSSILSVLLIGIDQYLAIVDPLRYRTRIDKLKCALLILAVWMIALLFGTLASLNPEPRSLWGLCSNALDDDGSAPAKTRLSFQASILFDGNSTEQADLEIQGEISIGDDLYNASARPSLGSGNNDTKALERSTGTTYGLIYAIVYALLGYLVPVLAIIWIYVRIYTAARSNSERTRRNGSRPILSTGSFCEEVNGYSHRPESSVEDFRRIPKISSLSSIDENSEMSPSQIVSDQQYQEEVEPVVFTVGLTKVEVGSRPADDDADDVVDEAKESTKSKVPVAMLKANFLQAEKAESTEESPDLVKSKFPNAPGRKCKSSHDLMYEEMTLDKHPYEYDVDELENSSDDDEEEEQHDYEEALPLSHAQTGDVEAQDSHCTTRSISVNFDLGDGDATQKQSSALNQGPPIVTITPPGQKGIASSVPLQKVPSVKGSNSYINNLKYRISNGSLFKYREETRAARISALVIIMGLTCWTPYVYVLVLRNLPESRQQQPQDEALGVAALICLLLVTYVSPLLFGYRSRRVKRELRKFFCFKRELSYKNNRSLMAKKVLRRRHSGATILGQIVGESAVENSRYNIFNCVYGRNRWPKEKVQFVQVPETALAVETCRSSFSSGASTQISSTSTDEC